MGFRGSFACAAEVAIGVMLLAEARAQAPAPDPGAVGQSGGQLQQMTVTGYLIPRAGEGPQPVLNYDRDYIEKTGYQTVTDVLQNLPSAIGNFAPNVTTGFSFSPG
jgi:hypothetical protein